MQDQKAGSKVGDVNQPMLDTCDSSELCPHLITSVHCLSVTSVLLWLLSTELWVNRTRIVNLPVPLPSLGSQPD